MASIQSSHERVSFKKSMSDPVRGWNLFGINYRLASCFGGPFHPRAFFCNRTTEYGVKSVPV